MEYFPLFGNNTIEHVVAPGNKMSETALDVHIPLREVLTESISAVKKREASALDQLLLEHQNRVVVFGCGGLGRRAIERLQELGIQPLALCDNNELLWGTAIQGISVLSGEQAAAQFGSNALFLIAVWNPHHWYVETEQRLKSAGAKFITSYAPLFWRFPENFLPVFLLNDLPSKVYEARDAVLEAENLWADEDSLQIYRANIHWRAFGNPGHLPPRPSENTYFPADIFNLSSNECILDCGAYDGDTVKMVLQRYASEFAAIYSIEGDAVAFEKLRAYAATLPPEIQGKIHPIHCAVGGTRTVVRFTSDGTTGLKRNEDIDVQCYPLDDISLAQPVTLIKMDIEGAEYDALFGARNMIARDKPLLAICVYHTQEDIWRIPLLIHSMLPEHSLFLRAYEGDGFQTVVYAVPTNRLVSRRASPVLSVSSILGISN
jgi:FkbM family methyltransferase